MADLVQNFCKPFIVWRNYYSEGWQPEQFDTLDEAIRAMAQSSYGGSVLTQSVHLTMRDEPSNAPPVEQR